ncbi:hypothetical protein AVEN_220195-1 [Araneus ventricosus]|uniref:Uncharacterized protein n=1 Tax=Araneus ventricosus TaxID=182803 RepID=A0A4Y2GZX2_ARAVE|nr:hypothetical protein AVEN_220195-1 [Araneus ventricosus]
MFKGPQKSACLASVVHFKAGAASFTRIPSCLLTRKPFRRRLLPGKRKKTLFMTRTRDDLQIMTQNSKQIFQQQRDTASAFKILLLLA